MPLANQQISAAKFQAMHARPVKAERAKRGTGAVGMKKRASALENKFAYQWSLLGGPELEREVVLLPPRKWRFDFVHRASKTVIEIHGGTFVEGRHTRGVGFANDRKKMLAAQEAGYLVVELTATDIIAANVERLIGVVRERMK